MNTMNRKWSRYRGPISGRIFLLIGLFLAFVTAAGAETLSGYGSGSHDDYGEACQIAASDADTCFGGTLTFGDCNCKKEEPGQDYYWSCSVKWTCKIPQKSDANSSEKRTEEDTDGS